jgi:hypothetical protein
MPANQDRDFVHEYYTWERWQNWITQVRNSGFCLSENEEESNGTEIFDKMQDDVILACLKVLAKHQNGEYEVDETLSIFSLIQDIVLENTEPISEDADMMIEFMQNSLIGVFASFEAYLKGSYDTGAEIAGLIEEALEAEKSENYEEALDKIGEIGALVLNGKALPEEKLENMPDGFVTMWIDGIDSIGAAMIGTDSYKEDNGDYAE